MQVRGEIEMKRFDNNDRFVLSLHCLPKNAKGWPLVFVALHK